MSEELKCPKCGHPKIMHDLFRGCMQFNCSCTQNKEQVDILLLVKENNDLCKQLENIQKEQIVTRKALANTMKSESNLYKQFEVAMRAIDEYLERENYTYYTIARNAKIEIERIKKEVNA